MKKIISLLLAAILALPLLSSCGGDKEYRTDVPVADISAAFNELIANSGMLSEIPEDYIVNTMKISAGSCEEFSVFIPTSGSTFDEFGIFKVADEGSVDTIKSGISDYILRRSSDELALDYIPEDAPKVTGAEIKTCGLYVAYVMLSDGEKAGAFAKLDELLS